MNSITHTHSLIGKLYTLFNYDGSVLTSFVIKHVNEYIEPEQGNPGEQDYVPQSCDVCVSENGSGYYRYIKGNPYTQVV